MACCSGTQRLDKDYVRNLAVRYSEKMEVDVALHVFSLRGVGKKVYDFTEDLESVGSNGLVEIIKFRRNKSKVVLSHPKGDVGDSTDAGELAEPKPKRIKRKPAKLTPKVANSNELAKKGKGK